MSQSGNTLLMNQEKQGLLYTDDFLIDNIPTLLCIKDGEGRWLHASSAYQSYFNIEKIDYTGKTNYELSQNDQGNLHALRLSAEHEKQAWETHERVITEKTLTQKDGSKLKYEVITNPVFDAQGNRQRLFITGRIITQDEGESLEQSFFASIYQCRHINIVIIDSNLVITHLNEAAALLTGLSSLEAIGSPLTVLFEPDENIDFKSIFNFNFDDNSSWQNEIQCRKKSKENLPVKVNISPIPQNKTHDAHYCVTLLDITEQKLNETRIAQIALFDDLTGLGNRIMFFNSLNKFISVAKRHTLYAIVFFIDLDNFKAVNDSLGHDAGDELLKLVGKRLNSIVREHDIVARFSGDEFAVMVLNEKSHERAVYEASMVAEKIIASISEVFEIKHQQIFIGCSIGVSIFPEDALSCEGLLKNADLAMYEAKNKGRNNYQFYKKEYTAAIKNKVTLENYLRDALGKKELHLFYQPQFEAESGKIWGAEVLIRWVRETSRGHNRMIPPSQFIPLAEESGLIIEIGKWVLERACKQHKRWLDQGFPLPRVAVNISTRQFMDNDFIQTVVDILSETKLPPSKLELEITESMLIGDTKLIELKLKRLKSYGISIALDDFGTGYSSLSYLKNFPIDILKIDQSFIREMTRDSKDARIASAIIKMGHSLGQKIIAEGVENEDQLKLLTKRGCDIIQGFYLSKPLPTRKMQALLLEHAKKS